MEISGKVAIVTGGASGAGRALALGLAVRGCGGRRGLRYRREGAAKVAAEIEAAGGRALAVPADMTREADVQALVSAATESARADRAVLLQRRDHRGGRRGSLG